MEKVHVPERVWDNLLTVLAAIAVGFLIYVFWLQHRTSAQASATASQAKHLAVENRRLTAEIQRSRVVSCRFTNRSIEAVALSFFPPPKQRDARQRRIARNLHRFIHRRVVGCSS